MKPPFGAKFDPVTSQPIPKFDPQTGKQNWFDVPQPVAQPVAKPVAQPAPAVEAAPVRRRVQEMRITFPSGAPLGVGLIQKDGKVVVDLVQPTSAAAAVPVGATIKEINGASCEGKGMKEVMAMIVDAKSAGEVTATFLVELAGVLEA